MAKIHWLAIGFLVAAALVNRYNFLLLRVPKYGYRLYYWAGGTIPPYVDSKLSKTLDQWGDHKTVVCSAAPRAGAHFMAYVLHQIRDRGVLREPEDLAVEVPWINFVYYPEQDIAERVQILKNAKDKYPNNFIVTTQDAPTTLKLKNAVKYVVLFRNPLDSIASLRSFYLHFDPVFMEAWGGFPPTKPVDNDEWYEMVMGYDNLLATAVTNFLDGWLPAIRENRPNVLVLHYSNLVKDKQKEVVKLTKFLGTELSLKELDLVLKNTGFRMMKQRPEYTKDLVSHLMTGRRIITIKSYVEKGKFLDKGPERQGEQELPPRLVESIKSILSKKYPPEILEFLYHGKDIHS